MWEFLSSRVAQWVIWVTATMILIAAGCYVIAKFRGYKDRKLISASEMLTNFREIRDRGGLSDAEYRNIKTLLSERLDDEVPQSKLLP